MRLNLSQKYVLRRNKKDILSDLPNLHEEKISLELNLEQTNEYEKIIKEYKSGLSNKNPLQVLTELRSVCDFHEESNSSSKIEATLKIVDDALKKE